METWLHVAGRSCPRHIAGPPYRCEITRRVSLRALQGMEFGDRVLLATREGDCAEVFGMFYITKLSGLSPEALDLLSRSFEVKQVSSGCLVLRRRHGTCVEVPSFPISALLGETARLLEEEVGDPGKLVVGGMFVPIRRFYLKNAPLRMGFRRIDFGRLENALAHARRVGVKNPVLRGQFCVSKKSPINAPDKLGKLRLIQTVRDYHKAPVGEPEERRRKCRASAVSEETRPSIKTP